MNYLIVLLFYNIYIYIYIYTAITNWLVIVIEPRVYIFARPLASGVLDPSSSFRVSFP